MASVWAELRRRNVVKVAVAYAIVGWLLVEVAATVLPIFGAPEWILQVFTFFIILGFPLALVFSWAFELTPEGIKKTHQVPLEESITHITGQKLNYVVTALLVIAVVFLLVENRGRPPEAPETAAEQALETSTSTVGHVGEDPPRDRRSIAVLPFENRSAQTEDEFFVGGIHDDILTQLAKIGALKVISRTSVMEYRDVSRNLREIGEQLGVATILEGAVQRAGDTVRINVQLIDAETDEHLWAETYDRDLTARNIFSIQSEMATSIAETLEATLSPEDVARLNQLPTQSTEAYNLYLTGNDYFRRPEDSTALPLAAQMYERAVQLDPQFAQAWAALSMALNEIYFMGIDRAQSRLRMSNEAVQRALTLAPDLPEAHLALGYYHYHGFRDYDNALREFGIAEQGMPGDARPHLAQAYLHRRMGDLDQSLASMERAIDLDPRNIEQLFDHSDTYVWLRDYARAEEYLERALEFAPDNVGVHLTKAIIPVYRDGDIAPLKAALENEPMGIGQHGLWRRWWRVALYERDYDTALSFLDDLEFNATDNNSTYKPKASYYGVTYQLAGQPDLAEPHFQAAREQIEEALETDPERAPFHLALGEVLAGLDEFGSAIRSGRRAIELMPRSRDARAGSNIQLFAAIRVFAPAGDHDAALDELDAYLSAPGRWSIEGLLPDPRLDPIRDDPRFQALVEKYRRP